MENQNNLPLFATFVIIAAFAYCLPLGLFIADSKYTDLWVLFVGNFLFLLSILSFVIYYSRTKHKRSLSGLVAAAFKVIAGSITLCLLAAVFFLYTGKHYLTFAPANIIEDRSGGLRPIVLMDAVLINLFTGAFGGFIAVMTIKRGRDPSLGG